MRTNSRSMERMAHPTGFDRRELRLRADYFTDPTRQALQHLGAENGGRHDARALQMSPLACSALNFRMCART